jgi:predicted metalloendopeptidase
MEFSKDMDKLQNQWIKPVYVPNGKRYYNPSYNEIVFPAHFATAFL